MLACWEQFRWQNKAEAGKKDREKYQLSTETS
jgi:hypothetical protein